MKNTAIVLAGGRGSRMKCEIPKQYLLLQGRPVLCYCLDVFQNCSGIDEIILVCGAGDVEKCRRDIVQACGFSKVRQIVPGGRERWQSVREGLRAADGCQYVLIHDGARPFVDEAMLNRILDELPRSGACVVGMPVKDTIKVADDGGYVESTPPREKLWTVQTPQSFAYELISRAYEELTRQNPQGTKITDDAIVLECFGKTPVKLIEGSYENIKITTPEDLILADSLLRKREKTSKKTEKN